MNLSVVIPLRNRSGIRLENCLRSLRWQEVDSDAVEILVVDVDSDADHRVSIRELATRYRSRALEVEAQGHWNRSLALNTGLKAAAGEVAVCTDVDMIFSPNFLSSIVQSQGRPGVMTLCRCHDLPDSVPAQLWERSDYSQLLRQAELRQTSGTGACQAARGEFFRTVRGYDEGYLYWGAEDADMVWRARRYGLTLEWMKAPSMLHQWHPTRKHDHRFRVWLNRMRYRITRGRVVKNRRGWGAPVIRETVPQS